MYLSASDTGFRSGLDQGLANIATLLPKIAYFLLILIIGIILAKVVSKILTKVLQKVGFDALVERGGIKKAMSKSSYDAAGILGKVVYYFIFLLVLSAAFGVFGADNPVSMFLAKIIAFLPNIFVAVLVLVIAAAIKDLLSNMLGGLSYGNALANGVSLFVIALGVFFALDQLKIAPLIVGGIFYALIALIVAPLIIAFGVGGIDPAREVIQDLRGKARQKADEVQQEVQSQSSSDDAEQADGDPVGGSAPVRRTRATSTRAATRATATRRRPTA